MVKIFQSEVIPATRRIHFGCNSKLVVGDTGDSIGMSALSQLDGQMMNDLEFTDDSASTAAVTGHPVSEGDSIESGEKSDIATHIEDLRRNLLDIGTRNRLISAPLKNARANVLEVVDEKADLVFASLWRQNSTFTFAANETVPPSSDDSEDAVVPVYVPPDDSAKESAARHNDRKLQTRLRPESLQKRLLTLQHNGALLEEEQGANVLFLAVGFLRWFEADSSEVERFAPLLLVPVKLERDRVQSRFRLRRREDDIEVNLSLQAKLKQDFGLWLPDLPDGDDWHAEDYFSEIDEAISAKPRWNVLRDAMLLGFFSYSKFLLYRDLDAAQWPEATRIDRNEFVNGLLVEGFDDGPLPIGEETNLDELLEPADLGHVLDADSSQTAVIKMAADGRNMVVQGPPGTGKSQTIANVIAAAAREGRTILFMAEKMAALGVVHERLRANGLDALCLELHSQKANKRSVYDELKRTLELGKVADGAGAIASETKATRDRLNELSRLLHTPLAGIEETPFRTIATLVRCREAGFAPPDFKLDLARIDSREKDAHAAGALAVLASRSQEFGPSSKHPWRGVTKRLNPIDLQRLKPRLDAAAEAGLALLRTIDEAAALLRVRPEGGGDQFDRLIKWLGHFAEKPDRIRDIARREPIRLDPVEARKLLDEAASAAAMRAEAMVHTSAESLERDWSAVRKTITAKGRSLFRLLDGDYRRSVAQLSSVSIDGPVKTYQERLRRLDSILDYQMAARHLAGLEERGKAAFGADWRGLETAAEALRAALDWYIDGRTLPGWALDLDKAIEATPDAGAVAKVRDKLAAARAEFDDRWSQVRTALGLDLAMAFDAVSRDSFVQVVVERLKAWLDDFDRLDEWFALAGAEGECRALGLDDVVEGIAGGDISPERAVETYRFARAEVLWQAMVKAVPLLGTIRGDERTELVERFRTLERQLFLATAREIAAKHAASMPTGAQGQMGFIRGQIARRRGHAPIRTLMASAGTAVQRIKPIFLMSPISVAQFLPPGSVAFDIVVIDEASQVRPEDAVGALARGRSAVVVGDSKQLPPTSFFDRTMGDVGSDLEDDDKPDSAIISAGSMESILTLCQARGLPSRTLRWHYRSRHPSLIQVSNQTFYDDKLKYPPSPERAGRDGLIFRRVEGVYDRGRTRTNQIEARIVAQTVIAHARERPDLSLGVATLSVPQRDAILAELELLRADHPDLEPFFDRSKSEPFFVKNLENVQGDERDVIFVSICYGRDPTGYMAQGFGPVSSDGGERRLNVLFTRAKQRCEIFSSIGHSDIDIRGATVPVGRQVLHAYLKFAETGVTDVPMPTGRDADSEFEVAVGNRIRAAGYEVDFQVGSAGFRIDIGVRDPNFSNTYVLGVECDGATYHSALWARERDRLRQQVLESKGWRLHRIWSTDWFSRPDAELRKVLTAIDRAKAACSASVEAADKASDRPISIEREKAVGQENMSCPYQEAVLQPLASYPEPHLVPLNAMAKYVVDVVAIEQPVHTDEVAKRVARAWGAQRTGSRIKATIGKALSAARVAGTIVGGPFWSLPDGQVQVRDRRAVTSTTLRNPEYLPPSEIAQAIREVVTRSVAVAPDDLAKGVAEALGYGTTTAQLKAVVFSALDELQAAGSIRQDSGLLRLEG